MALKNSYNVFYEDILHLLNSRSEAAQSYETLLNSLHLMNSTRPLKTVLVTSTQPEEGKTTVTVSLALTTMLAGKNALVIDADLRRPRIHEIFKLENAQGLSDVVTGTLDVKEIIRSVEVTNDPLREKRTLSVITSGRVSPNSFIDIGSSKLKEAMEHFRNAYDTVLVDSPPLLSVSDALVLAPMVDGVILVLNTGVVSERDAKRAKERLEQANGRVLGVVMNRFDEKLHGPGFHPYSNYYNRNSK